MVWQELESMGYQLPSASRRRWWNARTGRVLECIQRYNLPLELIASLFQRAYTEYTQGEPMVLESVDLSGLIDELLRKRGMTPTMLAARSGIRLEVLQRMRKNRADWRTVEFGTLCRLASGAGVPFEQVLRHLQAAHRVAGAAPTVRA